MTEIASCNWETQASPSAYGTGASASILTGTNNPVTAGPTQQKVLQVIMAGDARADTSTPVFSGAMHKLYSPPANTLPASLYARAYVNLNAINTSNMPANGRIAVTKFESWTPKGNGYEDLLILYIVNNAGVLQWEISGRDGTNWITTTAPVNAGTGWQCVELHMTPTQGELYIHSTTTNNTWSIQITINLSTYFLRSVKFGAERGSGGTNPVFTQQVSIINDDLAVGDTLLGVATLPTGYTLTYGAKNGYGGSAAIVTGGKSSYAQGDAVTLQATPSSGDFTFVSWEITGTTPSSSNSNPVTLTFGTQDITAYAVFSSATYVQISPIIVGLGSVNITPADPWLKGAVATLTAMPQPGYRFVTWQGWTNCSIGTSQPYSNPFTLTPTGDVSITAVFASTIPEFNWMMVMGALGLGLGVVAVIAVARKGKGGGGGGRRGGYRYYYSRAPRYRPRPQYAYRRIRVRVR